MDAVLVISRHGIKTKESYDDILQAMRKAEECIEYGFAVPVSIEQHGSVLIEFDVKTGWKIPSKIQSLADIGLLSLRISEDRPNEQIAEFEEQLNNETQAFYERFST